MALICDNCGNAAGRDRVTVAFGHEQEIALKGATAKRWFHYCDDCAERVKAMLENMRLYAMHGEGSGLIWTLTKQERNPVAEQEAEPVVPKVEAEKTEEEERELRYKSLDELVGWNGPEDEGDRGRGGTPLMEVLPHSPTVRKITWAGDVITLEEVAALCEAQFMGFYGVGAATMEAVQSALRERDMRFADGPTGTQLSRALRALLDERNMNPGELADCIIDGLGHPVKVGKRHTKARDEIFDGAWKLWEKRKCPEMLVLREIVKVLGYSVEGFLEYAQELEVASP